MKHHIASVASTAALALLSASVLIAFPASAQTCVQVEVHNIVPDQGMLMVAAYADAASFRKTPEAALQMRASASTLTFPLCGVAGSTVSLMLFQDLNANGKLDTNVLGIPSEPWGASGKPAPMSPPTWETTAVQIDQPITVKLSK